MILLACLCSFGAFSELGKNYITNPHPSVPFGSDKSDRNGQESNDKGYCSSPELDHYYCVIKLSCKISITHFNLAARQVMHHTKTK